MSDIVTVSILSLVKDNEKWLKYVIPQFAELEKMYADKVAFTYAFFENDSKDNTKELIQKFLLNKDPTKNKLITACMQPYLNRGVNFARVRRLADLRNKLVSDLRPLDTDYTLMIDSEIYFDPTTFGRMLSIIQRRTDIAMVTPYATQIYTNEQLQAQLKPEDKAKLNMTHNKIYTMNHYYDSFAFTDSNGRNFWPKCIFPMCKTCNMHEDTQPVLDGDGLCVVNSAFGGFALIHSDIMNDVRVKWDTFDLFDKYALCEHLLFCNNVRVVSGKKIVVDTLAINVHWTG